MQNLNQILNIAGYKFISLSEISFLQQQLQTECIKQELKGTILLSSEGINMNLAGLPDQIKTFQRYLEDHSLFSNMRFHETYSNAVPFKTLKVKIKKEIITMKKPEVNATEKRAPSISPQTLKTWLDENQEFTLLDTRNDYEVKFGTFANAMHLQLSDFSEFPDSVKTLKKAKPLVMFCTGGIRCEKAALYLLDQGFTEVYQLDGGILGYFAQVGGAHYQGECFVFDERIALDNKLNCTNARQCSICQEPIHSPQTICVNCIVA